MRYFWEGMKPFSMLVTIIAVLLLGGWLGREIVTVIGGWYLVGAIIAIAIGWIASEDWLTDEDLDWESFQLRGYRKPFSSIIFALCVGYLLSLAIGLIRNDGRELLRTVPSVTCETTHKRGVVLELAPSHIAIQPIMWHSAIGRHDTSSNSWDNTAFAWEDILTRELINDEYERLVEFAQPRMMIVYTSLYCETKNGSAWGKLLFDFRPLPQGLLVVPDTG